MVVYQCPKTLRDVRIDVETTSHTLTRMAAARLKLSFSCPHCSDRAHSVPAGEVSVVQIALAS